MKKTYQLTDQGRKELEAELETLKSRRSDIAEKIAEARDYGDLTENAEYDAAREEQGLVETRIADIEDILMNAEDIKTSKTDTVALGSNVTLKSASGEVNYVVVGPVEANPIEGKISSESPIGKALMGQKVGTDFSITTPKGETAYQLIAIK